MLGVDRLDMIKGIPQKLLAFEKFLEENPGWRNKVLLVQIAVPSRTDVPEYQARIISCLTHCLTTRLTEV
jgi:trehalose 6-phosphate synthase/phosphatase